MVYCNVKMFCDIQNSLLDVDTFISQCNGDEKFLEAGIYLCDLLINETYDETKYLFRDYEHEECENDIKKFKEAREKIQEAINNL